MTILNQVLQEAQHEAMSTRRLLERLPEERLAWRPHPRAYSLAQLASHIATLPGQLADMSTQDGVDLPVPSMTDVASKAAILARFDASLARLADVAAATDDTRALAPWVVRKDGAVVMTLPRMALLRTFLLNHWYHHRGQLATYLRILDVAVPSIYGASADEDPFA